MLNAKLIKERMDIEIASNQVLCDIPDDIAIALIDYRRGLGAVAKKEMIKRIYKWTQSNRLFYRHPILHRGLRFGEKDAKSGEIIASLFDGGVKLRKIPLESYTPERTVVRNWYTSGSMMKMGGPMLSGFMLVQRDVPTHRIVADMGYVLDAINKCDNPSQNAIKVRRNYNNMLDRREVMTFQLCRICKPGDVIEGILSVGQNALKKFRTAQEFVHFLEDRGWDVKTTAHKVTRKFKLSNRVRFYIKGNRVTLRVS